MDFLLDTVSFILRSPFILLGWLIVGAVAGDVARRFMGSADRGCLSDWVLGIIGAVVGGFLAGLFGIGRPDGGIGLIIANLVIAIIGAAVLIGISRSFGGGKRAKS